MEVDAEIQRYDDDLGEWVTEEKRLVLPDKLPGDIGTRAEQKLDAEMEGKRAGGTAKATIQIGSDEFSRVREYLCTTMVEEYNRGDPVSPDDLTAESKDDVARYYFNRLSLFGGEDVNDAKKNDGS